MVVRNYLRASYSYTIQEGRHLAGEVEEALDPAVVAGVLGKQLQAHLVLEVAPAVLHRQLSVPVRRRELLRRDLHHGDLSRGDQEAVVVADCDQQDLRII